VNISGIQVIQFEACKKHGFVDLNWEEGLSDLTGDYGHSSVIIGNKIIVRAFVVHKYIEPPKTRDKKYEVKVSFLSKEEYNEFGEALYGTPPHFEYNLECAFLYARWQATVILRLIGDGIEAHK
jgi:hypothetical protein